MALEDEASSPVDPFLMEAVNSRNRITVLRLEREIERFVRNPNQQDLLLKPMTSSYERLAAHRVAQHYGLQSMVVTSLPPSTSRILLVKTSSECKLPIIRLMDIPLENASPEKSELGEKFAIKKRESSATDANSLRNSGDQGRSQMKSMEEREEEYDKARARIFSPNRDSSNLMDESNRILDAASPKRAEENLAEYSSDARAFNVRFGEERSPLINSSRVAIFRDREKDMKDPDYDRNYKRYSQPLWMQTGIPGTMQSMHTLVGNPSEDYMRVNGSWGPHTQFQGPWMGQNNQNIFHGSFIQNQLDVYLQRPNFTGNRAQYGHMNDTFQYSFQPPGLQQMPRMSAMGR